MFHDCDHSLEVGLDVVEKVFSSTRSLAILLEGVGWDMVIV